MDTTGSLAQVMAETDGSGTVTAYYLYLGGLAARILPNGDLACYHTDRAGNVLALTDGGGSTTDLYQYDEFGVPAGSSGSSPNPFRYAGGFGVQTDATGTLFARQRVYHPDLGRFLSRDALFGSQQNGQNLNRYAAFFNDPYGFSDPSGLVNQHAVSPSFYDDWKSYVPVYGSWRDGMTAARDGRYWAAAGNTALAISDVFLVKSAVTIGGKIVVRVGSKIFARDVGEQIVKTTVYRVEGSINTRLIAGEGGSMSIQGDKTLFLNFGDEARAQDYLQRKIEQNLEGATLKSFEVPTSYVEQLRSSSVLEGEVHLFPDSPIRVDTMFQDQFGLRSQHFEELLKNVIPGSLK